MKLEKKQLFVRVAGLSALAGMRSMSGPALLSLDRKLLPESSRSGRFFRSPYVLIGANALALGELIADKLPFIPNRTAFPPLCARALSGAMIGASLYAGEELSPAEGAVVGGLSAIIATYATYQIRRTLTKTFLIPDFIIALVEDSLIVNCGLKISESQKQAVFCDEGKIDAQAPGHHGMMH
jgi:uncharacterized membrane protein